MTREQAIAFLQALNLAQPYVPPVIFANIAAHPLLRNLEAVANGLIEFEPKATDTDTFESLSRTVALLYASTKFDFSGYKKGTLQRRIQRRMSLRHMTERSAYVDLLRSDPAEASALFKDLLLKVTSFFRDPAAWQALRERKWRGALAAPPLGNQRRTSAWSAQN